MVVIFSSSQVTLSVTLNFQKKFLKKEDTMPHPLTHTTHSTQQQPIEARPYKILSSSNRRGQRTSCNVGATTVEGSSSQGHR